MYGRILDPNTGLPLEKNVSSSSSAKKGTKKGPSGVRPTSASASADSDGGGYTSGGTAGTSGADSDGGGYRFQDEETKDGRPGSASAGGNGSKTPPKEKRAWTDDLPRIKGSDGLGNAQRSSSKKKSNKPTELKKLSVKQLLAIEKKKQQDKEFREAYSKAIHRPTMEERVQETLEQYEHRMLFGTEPLGYEMSLQLSKKIMADSDLEQVQLQRHSNYFHKLCAEEKLEKDKEKYRKVKITLERPKSASAAFNAIMLEQFRVLDQREQMRTDMGFVKKHGYEKPKEEKPPLKSAGMCIYMFEMCWR